MEVHASMLPAAQAAEVGLCAGGKGIAAMNAFWPHQRQAFAFAVDRLATLLGLSMGCGKTRIALALLDAWQCQRVLILTPASCRAVWLREAERWSSTPGVTLALIRNTMAARTKWSAHFADTTTGQLRLVINFEAASQNPFAAWALSQDWDCIIIDEGHRLQRETRVSRFASALGLKAKRRLSLTGSVFTQAPASIYAQARFLDPDLFDGLTYKQFMARYDNHHAVHARIATANVNDTLARYGVQPIRVPTELVSGVCRHDEFLAKLSRIAIRIESAAVLNLPPLMKQTRECTLSPRAAKAYREIETQLVTDLGSGNIASAGSFLARAVRLQQATSGYLPDQDGKPHRIDHSKADALREILQAAGEPVVVFARFRPDLDVIRESAAKFGLSYGEISQRRKDGLTPRAEMAEVDVLGAQIQSASEGVDLSRARIAVFYSLTWSLKDFDQAISRIHRPPQSHPCVVYFLVAEGTVDERILRALDARRDIIHAVYQAMRDRASRAESIFGNSGKFCSI